MISAVLPTYARADISFERGEGVRLFTADGRRYLDFGAGVAVNALGHAHPHLVAALKRQAEKLWHCSNIYRVDGQEKVAARLVANSFADTMFFCNSGAEAIEGAIKMMRHYHYAAGRPERNRIITAVDSFHGRTIATISAAGQEKLVKGFAPLLDGFDRVPFGDLDAVRAAITPATAGILVEPIQGESGVQTAPRGYLAGLRRIADEHGILLALDEVQTGNGRTGKLYAHEWDGITPDIMATAKGLGGGFPLGAFMATEKAAQGMTAGTHGSTFGGNPLAMAVADAVLDVLLSDGFLDHVAAMGAVLTQTLDALVAKHPDKIEERRGLGLMQGLKCRVSNADLQAALMKKGLLLIGAGNNVLRILPPLIVTAPDIAEAGRILDETLGEMTA
ncbi:MAG: aspartate aminotransferase family protein [Rhodospirillaceae bacterium]|nr:aspartate aminotransferase family protein [Rhodospirillaceae bacterium]